MLARARASGVLNFTPLSRATLPTDDYKPRYRRLRKISADADLATSGRELAKGAANNFLKACGPEGRSVTGYGLGGRNVSAGVRRRAAVRLVPLDSA